MSLAPSIIGIQTVASVVTALTVVVLIFQIWNSNRWRKKSHSHQVLYCLVTEDFVKILNKIIDDHEWDIVGVKKNYDQIFEKLGNDEKSITKLNENLTSLFRFLESICISMRYGALDEQICREYLNDILPKIFFRNKKFVNQQREIRGNEEIFEWVEEYAVKWASKENKFEKKKRFHRLGKEHSFDE